MGRGRCTLQRDYKTIKDEANCSEKIGTELEDFEQVLKKYGKNLFEISEEIEPTLEDFIQWLSNPNHAVILIYFHQKCEDCYIPNTGHYVLVLPSKTSKSHFKIINPYHSEVCGSTEEIGTNELERDLQPHIDHIHVDHYHQIWTLSRIES